MDKIMVCVNADGSTFLPGCRVDYPVSGDRIILFGWKARSRLMDRATAIMLGSVELQAEARNVLDLNGRKDRSLDGWDLAGKINAQYPGGLPAFVTQARPAGRTAA